MCAACTLEDIYSDGTSGILLVPGSEYRLERRALSLIALEERSRGLHGTPVLWRAGSKMRKEVLKRKAILYALQRRMQAASECSVESAVHELTAMREQISQTAAAGQSSRRAKLCSMHQLAGHLLAEEIKPAVYEETVLLWPPLSTMPNGNPKAKERCVQFSKI